jgi:CelD/BcsL family acetyltransferase involved in cellulose biosynthesis
MLQLKEISSFEEFVDFRDEWNDLSRRSTNSSLPLAHEWVLCWWTVFGDRGKPVVICAYNDDQLVAAAPMISEVRKYRRVNLRIISLMTNMHTPYSDVLIDRNTSDEVVSEFIAQISMSRPEDIVQFRCLPVLSPLMARLDVAANSVGHQVGYQQNLTTPVIAVDSDWDTFFSSRSKKFRKGLRNKINRFARNGFVVRHHVLGEDFERYLEQIVGVSSYSWKSTVGTDLQSSGEARKFVSEIMAAFSPKGEVHAWIAYDGDTPMAYELQLLHKEIIYPIRADFDERFREHAPGSVVEFEAIKWIFEDKVARSYFSCADDYAYLAKWSDQRARFQDVEVFGTTWRAKWMFRFEYSVVPVLRKIRKRLGLQHKRRYR